MKDYKKVIQNIPSALIQLVKNSLLTITTPRLPKIKIGCADFMNDKCNNTFFREHFVDFIYSGKTRSTLILQNYNLKDQ